MRGSPPASTRRNRRHLPALELAAGDPTRITTRTSSAVFIIDALDPLADDPALAAADALGDALLALSPDATTHRRLIAPAERVDGGRTR